jgi:hypothetical protein
MQGKVVKLYSEHPEVGQKVNPLTGEVIEESRNIDSLDDVSNDAPELILPEDKKKEYDIKRQKKNLLGQYGFSNVSIIIGLLLLIPILLMVVFYKFLNTGSGKIGSLASNYGIIPNSYSLYITLGLMVILFLAGGLTMLSNKKSQYSLKKYDNLVNNINPKDFYPEEKILYNQEKESLKKQSFKAFSLPPFFVQIGLGVAISFLALFLVASITVLIPSLGQFSLKVTDTECILVSSLGLIFGILFGMIFQKKNAIMSVLFSITVLAICTAVVLVM